MTMLELSQMFVFAATILAVLTMLSFIVVLLGVRSAGPQVAAAGAEAGGGAVDVDASGEGSAPRGLAFYGNAFSWLALIALTTALVLRAIETGHGPFSNQYEFSLAFAWGILTVYIAFELRYHIRTIALVLLPITFALLLYAITLGAKADPLVPALQDNLLLTIHVATAMLAYGAFAVATAAAVLFLVQANGQRAGLPAPTTVEELGYKAVLVAFPFMTLTIVLGAIWADKAWGTYWSWDPKETASLVTWLVYGAFLHARVVHGWRGKKASFLLLLGFVAVIFTFLGNHFFGGLHSYGA